MPARFYPNTLPARQVEQEGSIWQTLSLVVLWIIVIVCFFCGVIWCVPLYQDILSSTEASQKLQREIDAEEKNRAEWDLKIKEMSNPNSSLLEQVARDKLDWGKPHESIIKVEPFHSEADTEETSNAGH